MPNNLNLKANMKLKLHTAWSARLKLMAEGDKLIDEGDNLWADGYNNRAEGNKLWADGYNNRAEGNKLWADGNKLRAEGYKLRADGDKLWADAIIEAYGDCALSWSWLTKHGTCTLENGDVYSEDQNAEAA